MTSSSSCGAATRYTLILINLCFLALGIAGAAIGGWVLLDKEVMRSLTFLKAVHNDTGMLQSAAIILIVASILIFLLGVMGCCGACKERKCLLGLYIAVNVLAAFFTIATIVVAFLYKNEVDAKLLNNLLDGLIYKYQGYTESQNDFSMALDYAQVEFECCGIRSYNDYNLTQNWTVRTSAKIPLTCCELDRNAYRNDLIYKITDKSCVTNPTSSNSNIDTPCYDKIKIWLEDQFFAMGGVAIATIIMEVLAVVFAAAMLATRPKSTNYLYRS